MAAIVGAEHVAKSAADGYTLLLTFAEAMVGNPALYRQLPYKPASDFVPIGLLAQGPLVVSIGKTVPAINLIEFVAHARKANLSWGSWGAGSHGHVLCVAMNRTYKLNMQHIPYKGEAPTVQGLLSGEIQIAAGSIGVMAPHLKSGALRALGTNGAARSLTLPQVPTLAEQGAGSAAFIQPGWVGLVAPANTPADIVTQWSLLVRDFLALESTRTRFLAYGFEPRYLDRGAFRTLMEEDARGGAADRRRRCHAGLSTTIAGENSPIGGHFGQLRVSVNQSATAKNRQLVPTLRRVSPAYFTGRPISV